MRINVKEATVTSNVPKENVTAMSISVDGMEHIMTLLTNLYKDPELAVIREYYTNALDAHTEAGVTAPVKITLPQWDDPSYRVQDFGVGMSKDDIINIYAQYGASTKRQTDDQLGAFGLGCKSALTITQQFTLVSIKHGMKTTVLIAKSESGVNTVNVISSVETNEGNGTTVVIPVSSRLHDFNQKARNFFAFSKPGTVLVDGREPVSSLTSTTRQLNPKDPNMEVHIDPKGHGESYVLMGPVPYALSHTEIELSLTRIGERASYGFIRVPKYFVVPIGSVDLTPSREGLRFTDRTNEVIDAHMTFLVKDLKVLAQKEIDESEDLEEFYERVARWREMVELPKSLYKGEEVPYRLTAKGGVRTIVRTPYSNNSNYEDTTIRLNTDELQYLVTGFSADDYKKLNGYITPYLTSIGKERGRFHITDDPDIFTNKWMLFSKHFEILDGNVIIEDGRAQRKKDRLAAAKANGSDKKSKIKYPVLFVDDSEIRWVEHPEIDESTPYLHSVDFHGHGISDLIRRRYRNMNVSASLNSYVVEYFEAVTDHKEIILLNGSRTVKALEQRVKKTFSILPEIQKSVEKLDNLVTEDLARHNALTHSNWKRVLSTTRFNHLVPDIKDPAITKIFSPDPKVIDQFQEYTDMTNAITFFDARNAPMPKKTLTSYSSANETFVEELNKKYPLSASISYYGISEEAAKHVIQYFNFVHEEHEKAQATTV